MNLTMSQLESCFNAAKSLNYRYVAVKIDIQGYAKPEIIINSIENYDVKLEYYKQAYDNNLILKNNNSIRIVGFAMGDTFENLEDELIPYYNN